MSCRPEMRNPGCRAGASEGLPSKQAFQIQSAIAEPLLQCRALRVLA